MRINFVYIIELAMPSDQTNNYCDPALHYKGAIKTNNATFQYLPNSTTTKVNILGRRSTSPQLLQHIKNCTIQDRLKNKREIFLFPFLNSQTEVNETARNIHVSPPGGFFFFFNQFKNKLNIFQSAQGKVSAHSN